MFSCEDVSSPAATREPVPAMLVALARVALALAVEAAALVLLVLRLLGGHQLAVMVALVLRPQSQEHQSLALAAEAAVVIILSALAEQVAAVMAVLKLLGSLA